MGNSIRLQDLARPVHSPQAREILQAVTGQPLDLSVAGVIQAAREQSDVPVFEDEALFARMQAYIEAVNLDSNLNAMGRMTVFSFLQRGLVQRSRLEALYLAHPEIDEINISAPLIIAGLPRSGTTHLLNLISADTRLRSLRYWESLEPIPSLAAQRGAVSDERYANGQAQLALQDALMPHFKSMYDVQNDSIHEEVELLWLDMATMLQATMADVPGWESAYLQADQGAHYAFLKRVLKALQWLRGPERWVLKSPQHLAFLPVLYQTFPDATFVVTHRDPVAIYTSWVTMLSYAARMSRQPVLLPQIAAQARRTQQNLLQGLSRDIGLLPEDQLVEVYFHEFMADDFATLAAIYERARLALDGDTRMAIQRYMNEHQRGRHGRISYDLEADFGIKRDDLYAEFAYYLEAFPVQRENQNS